MELRHLLYFKTVAEELHFTRAANRLFISQPPLSRQIKELEEELQVQLFKRSNKQVTLTNAGKYFMAEVDALFARLEESKELVRKIHTGVSGELKIGYISSVYQSHLAEILKSMQKEFPYLKTSLFEVPTLTQIKELEEGRLDVGILRAPVLSEKLKVESLFFDPFVVVIPLTDQEFLSEEAFVNFLKTSPFIFFNKDFAPQYNQKLIEICQRMGFTPDITHEANNVHSILQLVEAGLGVSILPSSLKNQYAQLKVAYITLDDIPVDTEVVLAYKESNQNPALEWFISHYRDNQRF
ncbi:LysR family transcriptional regulator [Pedobacter roseus]|uniref:LysR family transcriptional regulator n=1 Tax=Pedobacter roseus TaxID=336820 RepID=A0A7G9QAK0_9SPHI|nr:LysR substrate-binding domain-containing protein [Pedobacter roseus]QNN40375.1 LysR family transcriptional regulator [Pedobacter roseus]